MELGLEERRGERMGWFLGVVRRVIVRLGLVASLWVRSRRGIMWPCAGNGITSTCVCVVISLPLRTVMVGDCCSGKG